MPAEGIARRIAALTAGQEWAGSSEPEVAVFTRVGRREATLAPALAAYGFAAVQQL